MLRVFYCGLLRINFVNKCQQTFFQKLWKKVMVRSFSLLNLEYSTLDALKC